MELLILSGVVIAGQFGILWYLLTKRSTSEDQVRQWAQEEVTRAHDQVRVAHELLKANHLHEVGALEVNLASAEKLREFVDPDMHPQNGEDELYDWSDDPFSQA